MKNQKRPLTLTAGIVNVVICSLAVLANIIYIAALSSIASSVNDGGILSLLFVVYFITLAFSIVTLIFSSMTISLANKPADIYSRKKGIVITTLVFSILYIILSIIGLAQMTGVNTFTIILNVIIMLLFVMDCVFYIIDLCNNDKFLEEPETKEGLEEDKDMLKKLNDLSKLKNEGTISEQEFNALKLELLKKHINK